jgi:hypothetical protein
MSSRQMISSGCSRSAVEGLLAALPVNRRRVFRSIATPIQVVHGLVRANLQTGLGTPRTAAFSSSRGRKACQRRRAVVVPAGEALQRRQSASAARGRPAERNGLHGKLRLATPYVRRRDLADCSTLLCARNALSLSLCLWAVAQHLHCERKRLLRQHQHFRRGRPSSRVARVGWSCPTYVSTRCHQPPSTRWGPAR